MKTEDQIKEKAIELDGQIMMQQEAINTFKSCFNREATAKEKTSMRLKLFLFEAQRDVLTWILES